MDTATRNTATIVRNKIAAVKARRQDRETIAELEEIINELITDKNELVQIAQAMQDELTGQRIAEEDVRYITQNIIPLLEEIARASDMDDGPPLDSRLEALKSLLSVETIKILQLVGFNFKKAVGEPLTQLVSQLISSNAPPADATQQHEFKILDTKREIAYLNLVQDPESFQRLNQLRGGSA